jgi:hypothetical protein
MDTLMDTGLAEKAKAEELVASVPPMPEVESVDVRLYDDYSGEAALYLTFHIKSGALYDDAFFLRFNQYKHHVRTKILNSGISRFPYARLQEAA